MGAKRYTVHEAKTHLSRLIERAEAGEQIIIARGKIPVVRLVPVTRPKVERRFGAMKGQASVTDAFFEPLSASDLEGWGT